MAREFARLTVAGPRPSIPDEVLNWPAVDQADFVTQDPQRLSGFIADHIHRIEAANPRWRALSFWSTETIKAQMESISRRFDAFEGSVIRGVGITFKGNIPIEESPWTEGSAIYRRRSAAADAEVVRRTRQAGGIILGSTTLTELAMYAPDNPSEPVALNPFDPDRTPGGSSSGAGVAAALGMGAVHFGTDSGGSIRNPACHCGVVGFKPTKGLLPPDGLTVYSPTLDTLGVITRSAADLKPVLDALHVAEPSDHTDPEELGKVPGLLVPWLLVEQYCSDEVLTSFSSTIRDLEALLDVPVVDISVPSWIGGESAAGVVSLYESGQALARIDLAQAGPVIRERVTRAQALAPQVVEGAYEAIQLFAEDIHRIMMRHAGFVVATPTWPVAAPHIHQSTVTIRGEERPLDPWRNIFVRAANAADVPAITIPCAPLPNGLVPVGVHLTAPRGADLTLIATAVALERALASLGRRAPPAPPILSDTPHQARNKD